MKAAWKSASRQRLAIRKMVDFHSHILPAIDDGSASLEESVKMLQTEAEQGIRKVIATPHFYAKHDSPERFLSRRKEAERRLREVLADHPGLPEVHLGAEVYYFPGIGESELISGLTIDKTRCILLEMPHSVWTAKMFQDIENIYVKQGLIPIIAHIDRYIAPFKTYGIPARLEQLPVYVQANANFFLRPLTAGMAMRMLKMDQIHVLGSDCHNMTDRKPNLGEAFARIRRSLGEDVLLHVASHENAILNHL